MSNSIAVPAFPPLPPYQPPVCPPWCARTNHECDFDEVAGVRYADHVSSPVVLTGSDPSGDPGCPGWAVKVWLHLFECPDTVAVPAVTVGKDLGDPAMSLDETGRLARTLLATVALARGGAR